MNDEVQKKTFDKLTENERWTSRRETEMRGMGEEEKQTIEDFSFLLEKEWGTWYSLSLNYGQIF